MTENRVIHTADELDATPYGTIVMDKEGTPYQHHDDSPNWYSIYGGEEWANQVLGLGPVTVLHEPEEPKPVLPTVGGSRVKITYNGAYHKGVYDEVILVSDDTKPGNRVWRIIKQDGKWGAFGYFNAGEMDDWSMDPSYSWEVLFDAGAANNE